PTSLVANVSAPVLGLADRYLYLKADPAAVEARGKLQAHVAAVLALGGMQAEAAGRAAADILGLEARLAEASLPAATAADPAATAQKGSFAELRAARFDWERYFADAGLAPSDVNVAEPALLERVDAELGTTPVPVWKAYLTWQLLEAAS